MLQKFKKSTIRIRNLNFGFGFGLCCLSKNGVGFGFRIRIRMRIATPRINAHCLGEIFLRYFRNLSPIAAEKSNILLTNKDDLTEAQSKLLQKIKGLYLTYTKH